MSIALYLRELRRGAFPTFVIGAILALYIVSVVHMYDPAIARNLGTIVDTMPDVFAAFGMSNAATTMTVFLVNYLYGFLLTWVPLLLVMMTVNRMVVRPVEGGSLSYLLSTPTSRLRIAATFVEILLTVLAVTMALIVVVQVVCAESQFPGELDRAGLLRASVGLLCLWVFMAGLGFASACCFRDARVALWAGGGAFLLMLLAKMVSQVGKGLELLQDANPIGLFDPYELVAASGDAAWHAAVLAVAGVVLLAVGVAVFCRRDFDV